MLTSFYSPEEIVFQSYNQTLVPAFMVLMERMNAYPLNNHKWEQVEVWIKEKNKFIPEELLCRIPPEYQELIDNFVKKLDEAAKCEAQININIKIIDAINNDLLKTDNTQTQAELEKEKNTYVNENKLLRQKKISFKFAFQELYSDILAVAKYIISQLVFFEKNILEYVTEQTIYLSVINKAIENLHDAFIAFSQISEKQVIRKNKNNYTDKIIELDMNKLIKKGLDPITLALIKRLINPASDTFLKEYENAMQYPHFANAFYNAPNFNVNNLISKLEIIQSVLLYKEKNQRMSYFEARLITIEDHFKTKMTKLIDQKEKAKAPIILNRGQSQLQFVHFVPSTLRLKAKSTGNITANIRSNAAKK